MHAERRARLRALLSEHGLDALLVTTPANVRYLTGFTGSAGEALVTVDEARDVFVTDGRYGEQAAAEVPDLRRLVNAGAGWLVAAAEGLRLGLEAHTVSWQRARRIGGDLPDVAAAPALVEQLRQVKDDSEVAALRTACAVADSAFAQLTGWLRPGLSERDVARRVDRCTEDAGADAPSFATITAFGPHSAVPHHRPTDRRLAAGEIVKVDFGALVDGYHSDMTRMLSVGRPDPRLLEVYDVVRRAQRAGVAAATGGAGTGDVDAACRDAIETVGLGAGFVHGTGHGVGLQIHEDPFLRPTDPRPQAPAGPSVTLQPGMTVTVEPGVYLPGVGGVRIEDTLLITSHGPDVLTRTPKDLVVL